MNRVEPIVSVKWLADILLSSSSSSALNNKVRVLDGSYHLPDANRNPRAEYAREHVPGALFFDIDECADHKAYKNLPHMLPPKAEDFEAYVGRMGISNDTHVVVYDSHDHFPVFSAERVWWTFRVFGHEKISVLDGGLRKWRALNYPLSNAVPQVTEEKFKASFNGGLVKTFEEMEASYGQYGEKTFTLFDTRPEEYFEGRAKSFRPDVKMGSIPGSVNFPFPLLMDLKQQRFKSREELLGVFEQFSLDLSAPVVATCGSGVWACHLALAASICGKDDVAVYDGSWIEWYLRARPDQRQNVLPD